MDNQQITFFNIGNADTTLLELADGRRVLFDYAHMKTSPDDRMCDLPSELNKRVAGDFSAVCFTHADRDHYNRFSEYFWLEHATKYQGEGRRKIHELWVPAALLIEPNLEGEAGILRAEARYRLINKKGIRIFSRPKKFRQWCEQHKEINYDEICHLIVDAGTLIPGYNKVAAGVEFFVHSPFYSETQQIDRNNQAIVVQATFQDRCQTKLLLGSDIDSDTWADIVRVTRAKGNEHRLAWTIFHLSHHCSYRSLNLQDKGQSKTMPNPEVAWLLEQGESMARLISPSCAIELREDNQPPHVEAANCYKEVAENCSGEFIVTMEYPDPRQPRPLVIEISETGCARIVFAESAAATFVYERTGERNG